MFICSTTQNVAHVLHYFLIIINQPLSRMHKTKQIRELQRYYSALFFYNILHIRYIGGCYQFMQMKNLHSER